MDQDNGTTPLPPTNPISQTASHAKRPSRSVASYPRKRAISACLVCRSRKTKCDNQRPRCGFCQQTGAECGYNEGERLATFDAASLAILDRLSHLETLVRGQRVAAAEPYGGLKAVEGYAGPSSASPDDVMAVDGTAAEAEAAAAAVNDADIPVRLSVAAASRLEDMLDWPVFRGTCDPRQILAPVFRDAEDRSEGEATASPRDVDNGASCGADRLAGEQRVLESTDEVPALVQRFFRNMHTKNPILDVQTLDLYASEIGRDGFRWNGKSCLVLLVCALGAISAPYKTEQSSPVEEESTCKYPSAEIARHYFDAARRRLGIVITSNSLVAVQCLFLAGIYYMCTMRQFAAWKMFNAASMSCQGYLNRKEKSLRASPTPQDTNLKHYEQRVYWSCLKSEIELCKELDLPPSGLAELDCPHAFPLPPEDPPAGSSAPSGDPLTWVYYLSEIALRKVELRIDLTTSAVTPLSTLISTTREFELQLDLWRSSLPAPLQFPPHLYDLASDERIQYLRGRYCWILAGLYRPFVYLLVHGEAGGEEVRAFAEKGCELAVAFVRNCAGRHRHYESWLTLRGLTNAALVLLAAAKGIRRARMPPLWREAVEGAKELISAWESEAKDAVTLKGCLETTEKSMGFVG